MASAFLHIANIVLFQVFRSSFQQQQVIPGEKGANNTQGKRILTYIYNHDNIRHRISIVSSY